MALAAIGRLKPAASGASRSVHPCSSTRRQINERPLGQVASSGTTATPCQLATTLRTSVPLESEVWSVGGSAMMPWNVYRGLAGVRDAKGFVRLSKPVLDLDCMTWRGGRSAFRLAERRRRLAFGVSDAILGGLRREGGNRQGAADERRPDRRSCDPANSLWTASPAAARRLCCSPGRRFRFHVGLHLDG
jgi:hypothetical protein